MYRIWIKDEFSDNYTMGTAETDSEVKKSVLEAARVGAEVLLTMDVAFELIVVVGDYHKPILEPTKQRPTQLEKSPKEDKVIEVKPSEDKSTKNPGG